MQAIASSLKIDEDRRHTLLGTRPRRGELGATRLEEKVVFDANVFGSVVRRNNPT
jgi:hypothetical protein